MKKLLFLVLAIMIAFTSNVYSHDGVPEASTGFRQPLDNYNYSGYHYNEWSDVSGCYHPGSDYNGANTSGDGDLGKDVLAVANGKVVDIVTNASFGLCMTIEHRYYDTTVYSQYAHLQSTLVSEGGNVTKGQHIAELGNSGTSCGTNNAHLHWEIRKKENDDAHTADWWNTSSFQSRTNVKNGYEDATLWCSHHASYEDIQAKFDDVKQRNGGTSTVGSNTNAIHWYGAYLRQDFSGGSYGTCCIMFDPYNQVYNPAATNEAYLLRTGFYSYYINNGGWGARGCPSRDEYTTGDGTNSIQFFVRRVWNATKGGYHDVGIWETQFHYMYYDPTPPQGNDVIEWYSTYATDWVSQTPGGVTTMVQGSSQTFTVHFKNTGTTTWYNNLSAYPYDYISLKSADPSGNTAVSLLNNPYNGNLGWLNDQTPCTMQEASVAPNGTATFTFTGMVAPDRQLGLMDVYFRPSHSLAGLLDGWDGMHFQVNVVAAPTTPLTYMTGPAPDATIAGMIASRKTTPLNNKNPYGFWQSPQQVSGGFNATYWWYDYSTTEAYMPDYTSRICYVSVATGQPGAIVHDVYGAARQSFYVGWWPWDHWAHMGWNCGACPNPAGTQVTNQGGPYSCLGMPITNLYRPTPNEGYGRQDFQRGYIINGVIYCYDHITAFTPGWTASGWNQFWSYAITDCYDRYGAAAGLGHATQLVNENWDGTGYKIQPFDGGIYGSIMLVYNPNGPSEAYGVSGSFLYAYTMALDGSGVRISTRIGSPTEAFSGNRQQFQSGYMTINYGTNETFVYLNDNTEIWNSQTGAHLGKVAQTALPSVFAVGQNYPNPFNPATTIAYTLPSATHVTLDVYNILGQRVVTLVDEQQTAGEHTATWDANPYSSGVYFYRLQAGEATETKKMLLLK
ncbi:MAG: peptidoglycan DD-metalloendopeptidase family protein [Patescibacteria group bacterium]|jgi:murein DD-endopeptidase MepM/ murein hydrolase activator NlpD